MKTGFSLALLALLLFVFTGEAAAQINASEIVSRLGYPPNSKLLIIHADDFGVAHSANRAIEKALENGWVTSASIMVPCPWFPEAADFARRHPEMDIGLHLTFTSEWNTYRWGPVSHESLPSLLDKDGFFPQSQSVAGQQNNPSEVSLEVHAQIEKAKAAGVRITHLDSHMGTLFQTPELFKVYQQAAQEYKVPELIVADPRVLGTRNFSIAPNQLVLTKVVMMTPGTPLNQWLNGYEDMLTLLRPGVYELIVHLGYDDAELQGVMHEHPDFGAAWREADLKVVSSPEFHQFLRQNGFVLVTWKGLSKAGTAEAAAAN
jgi:predicted glycoside hydrolase/deacetylase ChbG (UPF0249 family)